MLNEVNLLGNVGTDVKYVEGEKPRASFSLATTFGYGEDAKTTWHNVTVFNKTAEACHKYLKKGNKVHVSGSINNYEYEDKDGGGKRYGSGINAQNVLFLTPKGESTAAVAADITADEIPF